MEQEQTICLCGCWDLYFFSDQIYEKSGRIILNGQDADALGVRISAQVPGNVETALEASGIIPNPFYGSNLLQMEQFEYNHFVYVRQFWFDQEPDGTEKICFDGIDTYADVICNGALVGKTDNMLISHTMQLNGLKKGQNELLVHIYPAVLEARKYEYTSLNLAIKYNYDALYVRKAASMYGWDIMPRMVSAGIWRGVHIFREQPFRLLQAYLYTRQIEKSRADLDLFYEVALQREPASDFEVSVEARCGEHVFTAKTRVWGKSGKIQITVDQPRLWWPKGYGAQNLYQVSVRLLQKGVVIDNQEFETGIRTAQLLRTGTVDNNGNGKFHFLVNGKPVFVLGTNWVPTDALPARGDTRAPGILELVDDIGCNAIRIWGGGKYEQDSFYRLCDQKGILVWQDFMMACGNYPQTEEFAKRLGHEIKQVVRKLRHHPSIFLWAGDNECDQNYQWQVNYTDPNQNTLTRELIPGILLNEDFTRPYLPSSPYIDEECVKKGFDFASENHLWGERKYYKSDYYKNALAVFASEMGYHGCPSPESVKKFITADALWPYHNNQEWLLHSSSPDPKQEEPFGYRVELMANQIREMFGTIPDSLEEFALASQISQAEAKKYFIERFRIKKWKRSGIIWWNICDGWPQFSDAVVDYYYVKKLAYHYIQRSQQPLCLMIDEPENGMCSLVGVNDTLIPHTVDYQVVGLRTGKILAQGNAAIKTEEAQILEQIPFTNSGELLLIEWQGKQLSGKNSYLMGNPVFGFADYVKMAENGGLLSIEGFEWDNRLKSYGEDADIEHLSDRGDC